MRDEDAGAPTLVGHGLISDDIIDQIKNRIDITDVVGHHVSLTKAGQNLKGLCPFHQEKTPSFNVNPDKKIFHCFGCGVGGDVFKFVQETERVDFLESVRRVATRSGIPIPAETPPENLRAMIRAAR